MRPTRKWLVATITAAGTVAVAIIDSGWNHATQVVLIGLVVQRAVAFLTPNHDTPGGVPIADEPVG